MFRFTHEADGTEQHPFCDFNSAAAMLFSGTIPFFTLAGKNLERVLKLLGQFFDIFGRPAFDFHAEGQTHGGQNFLDLVQRLATEVRRAEHLRLRLLDQVANVDDVVVLQAVRRAGRQFEFVDLAEEVLVERDLLVLGLRLRRLRLLEVDEERNRLVLSHRRALVERKMNRLEVGEVVLGTVRGIKPYGAFIDIGGVSGLLHISEISHEHIETPHTVLNVNDQMKVMIIDLDAERGRISLSTKALEPEPGDMLTDPQKVFEKAEEMAARYKQMLLEQAEDGDTIAIDSESIDED